MIGLLARNRQRSFWVTQKIGFIGTGKKSAAEKLERKGCGFHGTIWNDGQSQESVINALEFRLTLLYM